MRKPLVALSLAVSTSLGAMTVADALAAPPAGTPLSNNHPASSVPASTYQSDSASTQAAGVSGAAIVQTAMKYIGYPYTATGNSPSTGFSCIGFVSFVYRSNGIQLPGDLGDAMAYAPAVSFSDLQPGDILYFQNTVWTGLSHAAIYIGGGKFIHSEYYGVGVRISSFYNDPKDGNYWIQHYLGANRPWTGAAVAPVITAPSPSTGTGTAASQSQVGTAPVAQAQARIATGPTSLVTVPSLNVRARPSLKGTVREVVNQGTSVVILGHSGGWYKVQLPDGTVGWIVAAGIGQSTPQVTTAAAPNGRNGANPTIGTPSAPVRQGYPTVSSTRASVSAARVSSRVAGLRVHTSPSLSAGLVTTAYKGEKMTVIARQGSWVEVRMPNGQIGWVSAAYTSGSHRASGTATYQSRAYSHTAVVSTTTTTFSGTKARAAINVHAAPSLKGTVVTVIAPGQKYQVLGWSNGWAHVRLANGATGWVSGTVLGSPKATYHPVTAPTTARTSSRYAGHYLTAGVRVHATASLKGKVVTVAAKGTHVVVLGFSNGFALIRLPNGTTGYVYGSYVR